MKKSFVLLAGLLLCISPLCFGQVGIFENQGDIGAVDAAGSVEFDEAEDMYVVQASGADIWNTADEFFFVYNEMTGPFTIKANVYCLPEAGEPTWAKAGLMVRNNLTAGSSHGFAMIRAQGNDLGPQWRATQGGSGASDDSKIIGGIEGEYIQGGDIELERFGKTLNFYYIDDETTERVFLHSINIPDFEDPVYVGLATTSHSDGLYSIGEYKNVEIIEYPYGVSRSISATAVGPGQASLVVLEAEIRDSVTDELTFVEDYPEGSTVANINASAGQATDDGDKITWKISGAPGIQTLKYDLNVSATAPESGVLSGTYDGGGRSGSIGDVVLTFMDMDPDDLGIFQGHQDIGAPGADGGVIREGDTWKVIGSGHDIWDAADDFHYLWLKTEGDFTMSIEEPYIGSWGPKPSSNTWQKIGVMVRQDLTAPSAFASAALRSSDQAFMIQWRESNGAGAAWDELTAAPVVWNPNWDAAADGIENPTYEEVSHGGKIMIQREGDYFMASYEYDGEIWVHSEYEVIMNDPVYVGVAVTSHEAGSTSQGVFKNPQLEGSIVGVKDWMLH